MSTRATRTADKATNEKHSLILKKLMALPENKVCCDCKKKDPRWASWNLGCFMCIRCSGIHRSMGTHISKVKSCDLDSWTPVQIENMVKWGNAKSNYYWQGQLPQDMDVSDTNIDQWIRAKYERKQYAREGNIPDPDTITLNESSSIPATSKSNDLVSSKPLSQPPKQVNLFDSPPPAVIKQPSSNPTNDLFEAFSSPPPTNNSPSATTTNNNFKNDILSLYSKPSTTQQPQQQGFGNFVGGRQSYQQQPSSGFGNFMAPQQQNSGFNASQTANNFDTNNQGFNFNNLQNSTNQRQNNNNNGFDMFGTSNIPSSTTTPKPSVGGIPDFTNFGYPSTAKPSTNNGSSKSTAEMKNNNDDIWGDFQ